MSQLKFEGNNKHYRNNGTKYKLKAIWDIAIYASKSERGHLTGLYYLII